MNVANLQNQITQLKNLNLAMQNNQTNFVPGFLTSGICKIVAFSISSSRARASLVLRDEKVVEFLENLMMSCIGQIDKVNPQLENSFVYFNISELVKATFKKYPNLNQKVCSIVFENVAQSVFKQIFVPAITDQMSQVEINQLQTRYGQILLYFKAQIPQIQSQAKLRELQEKLGR
jgi:hypothetical protein